MARIKQQMEPEEVVEAVPEEELEEIVETAPVGEDVVEAGGARPRYRALRGFQVDQGDRGVLVIHAGRRFSSDEIPFDPDLMERID